MSVRKRDAGKRSGTGLSGPVAVHAPQIRNSAEGARHAGSARSPIYQASGEAVHRSLADKSSSRLHLNFYPVTFLKLS